MVDLKGMYQGKAKELALMCYNREFSDLVSSIKLRLYARAVVLVNETFNHKGEWCWVNPNIFCQEGFCVECQIYKGDGR